MDISKNNHMARQASVILRLACLCVCLLGASTAHAIMITGKLGIVGSYAASGGTDLSDATVFQMNSIIATAASGDISTTVGFMTMGNANNPISLVPTAPAPNLLTIGGWQLDLTNYSIVDQTARVLTMTGSGMLSGNGFDETDALWTLSANIGSSYSMTIAAVVPQPGVLALLGIGILGLAVQRRMRRTC